MAVAMAKLRVMVVDDHQMVVQALVLAISREPDIEVVTTASTVREAVDRVSDAKPDVLLIDYYLPDGTGVDAVRALEAPALKVVFLSSDRSDGAVLAALEAGACGYLVKSEPLDQLVAAVRRAGEGEILLQPGELVALLGRQRERQRREAELQRVSSSRWPRASTTAPSRSSSTWPSRRSAGTSRSCWRSWTCTPSSAPSPGPRSSG